MLKLLVNLLLVFELSFRKKKIPLSISSINSSVVGFQFHVLLQEYFLVSRSCYYKTFLQGLIDFSAMFLTLFQMGTKFNISFSNGSN